MSGKESHQVSLGSDTVAFSLKRASRKTLAITVHPDGEVLVTAPLQVSLEDIKARVHRRGGWIQRTRREFAAFHPRSSQRRYVGGETHRYLGRQLRLSIRPEEERSVQVLGGFLVVGGVGASDVGSVERMVQGWYQRQARTIFADRLTHCLRLFRQERIASPVLSVRKLLRRWGSMSRDGGRLLLNSRLVEAPRSCIDYVIVHELCHVLHPHHGPAFFDLLSTKMPDWERRKKRLEKLLA